MVQVLVDMRPGDVPRLAESLVCPDAPALAKLPLREDALVIGSLPAEAEAVPWALAKSHGFL